MVTEWFLNFRVHINHLQYVKIIDCCSLTSVSDFVDLGWGVGEFAFLTSSQKNALWDAVVDALAVHPDPLYC